MLESVAFVVGIVVGAGIFKTPALVAANAGTPARTIIAWALGGAVSLVGALCYAELAATYPSRGGEYHFLHRAFGRDIAFLFAWSRFSVIQTGSIAMQAFLVGDFASVVVPLGPQSSSIYAALTITGLTAMNLAGLRQGARLQAALTAAIVVGLGALVLVGLAITPAAPSHVPSGGTAAFGLAMVFVLLTYGGWSEAAYLSGEQRGGGRAIVRVLVWGLGLVTVLYVVANVSLLRALGFAALSRSDAVGADLMRTALGGVGAAAFGVIVAFAALSSTNATIFTGARTTFAVGRDFDRLALLGRWSGRGGAPTASLAIQAAAALFLVAMGTLTRGGFVTMVEYTAPVFWLFLALVAAAVPILRRRDARRERPFRVPLYPLTPALFGAAALAMFHASLVHTGAGALVGVAVLLAGLPVLLLARRSAPA